MRLTPQGVAEKYLNQRTRAVTQTHQEALQQFHQVHGRGMRVEDSAEIYYQQYRDGIERDRVRFAREKADIEQDESRNAREKRLALEDLTPAREPAWGEAAERAFIKTYGDPRASTGAFIAVLNQYHEDFWVQRRPEDGTEFQQPKTPWEAHCLQQLYYPSDGSVPMLEYDAAGNPTYGAIGFAGTGFMGDYNPVRRAVPPVKAPIGREGLTYGVTQSGDGRTLLAADSPRATMPPMPSMNPPQEIGQPPAAAAMPPMPTPGDYAPPAPPAPAIVTPQSEAAGDPKLLEAQRRAAEKICPHCYDSFERLSSHIGACARKHGKEEPASTAAADATVEQAISQAELAGVV